MLADRFGVLDTLALANVVRTQLSPAAVIAHGHPLSAAPAEQQPLQQRGSFARWTFAAVSAIVLCRTASRKFRCAVAPRFVRPTRLLSTWRASRQWQCRS